MPNSTNQNLTLTELPKKLWEPLTDTEAANITGGSDCGDDDYDDYDDYEGGSLPKPSQDSCALILCPPGTTCIGGVCV